MATRPCRCGYLDDAGLACNRAPRCALDYQNKISGPLYDRIDLFISVPAVSAADLSRPAACEVSAAVAVRVAAARNIQAVRFEGKTEAAVRTNAQVDGRLLEDVAAPDAQGRALLDTAVDRFRLSARAYHRVLRVARTIADLAGAEDVTSAHVAEALSYRRITPALLRAAAE